MDSIDTRQPAREGGNVHETQELIGHETLDENIANCYTAPRPTFPTSKTVTAQASQLSVHEFMRKRDGKFREDGGVEVVRNVSLPVAESSDEEEPRGNSSMAVLHRLLNPPRRPLSEECQGSDKNKGYDCRNDEIVGETAHRIGGSSEIRAEEPKIPEDVGVGVENLPLWPLQEEFQGDGGDVDSTPTKGRRRKGVGRPKGSKTKKKGKETEGKRSGPQWKKDEVLILAKAWVSQTQQLVQTEETL